MTTLPLTQCTEIECLPTKLNTLYKHFFTAAIAVVLTAGATWGGIILFQIAAAGKFTGVDLQSINAHGHAQIYGWMGLFIMGFAYHVLPRLFRAPLAAPTLAPKVLALILVGITVRTFGMTRTCEHAVPLAMLGCTLELAAVSIFATQILLTFKNAQHRLKAFSPGSSALTPTSAFLLTAMFWFILMTLLDTFHTYTTMTAPNRDSLLWYIATFQAPLRDLQIHGLALFMILGISSKMLPAFYSKPQTPTRRAWLAYALLTFAVAAEVAIFLTYRFTNNHIVAAFLMLPWLALATGVAVLVLPWKLWQTPKRPDRSDKFIRTAYLWLAISLAMLLFLPAYQAATKIPFSHAYYGAIRHAITVGFVSMMILGMASRLVPPIRGIASKNLPNLTTIYLLLNLGCFLRVTLQTLTDITPAAYPIAPISAIFEITALTLWSIDLLKTMYQKSPNPA
jgi:hypothetical protein